MISLPRRLADDQDQERCARGEHDWKLTSDPRERLRGILRYRCDRPMCSATQTVDSSD